ncbi:Protein CBG13599 [Caenorhabditis briggsae]|uniref:Protein CBG13599 n=1 Tax=Caenorhabditis briggsae TaxID=6238 RepID=A8XI99_CAEBR|nr:Protein CBG13599 [Caenorhabditis briggsae]CAP32373.2 Protein CBG13599 [Caenorhabditis briggsae]
MQRANLILTTIFAIFFIFHTTEARFERVGFVRFGGNSNNWIPKKKENFSDPVKLLLQDSYSSLKNRMYSQKLDGWKKPTSFRQIRKRKYTAFPPTFYSSFDIGAIPFNSRRSVLLPYNDLLFSGRK